MKHKFLVFALAIIVVISCTTVAFAANSTHISELIDELRGINGANVTELKDSDGNSAGYIVVTKSGSLADEEVNAILGNDDNSQFRIPDMQSCQDSFNVNFITPDGKDDRYQVTVYGTFSQVNNAATADKVTASGGYKVDWDWYEDKVDGHPEQIAFIVEDSDDTMQITVYFKVHANGSISVVNSIGAGADYA